MTIEDILNADPMNGFSITREAKTSWAQLGISNDRWIEISQSVMKAIKKSEEVAEDEFHRKLILTEKLAEISKITQEPRELALLSAAIVLQATP